MQIGDVQENGIILARRYQQIAFLDGNGHSCSYQLLTEYGIQLPTEYPVQFTTECPNQFVTEYPVQLTTEYPNQLRTNYDVKMRLCHFSHFIY